MILCVILFVCACFYSIHQLAFILFLLLARLQWVLSPKYFNFPLPITLTMIHMGFSGLVAFFLIRVFKVKVIFKVPVYWSVYSLYDLTKAIVFIGSTFMWLSLADI